jgi:hypothetical protein
MYVRDGRVMSNFILKALANEPIVIYGDGSYTRSFQYVSDLVEGIDRMMRQEGFLGPVNLGNPHEITIKELAQEVIKATGSSSQIIYKEAVTDDPVRRQPDISLAREKLGWKAEVSLEEGIEKTVEYFRNVELPDKKLLVLATTFLPDVGPAEQAMVDLAQAMPETEFHVVTTKSRKDLPAEERQDNIFIYRVGSGNRLGKFLFPFRGARKARKLAKQHKFRFVWAVMASYAGLAGLWAKRSDHTLNFLLTYDKSELEGRGFFKRKLFSPLIKYMFQEADSVYLSDVELEEQARLYDKNLDLSVMSADGKALVSQVKFKYTELLNKQEKKLERPL